LAAAWNSTLPLPCPEAGVRPVIQVELDDAVHVHSGSVDTVTAFLPPPASIDVEGALRETWHFTGEGPVEVDDFDSHATAVSARMTANDRAKPRAARRREKATLDRQGRAKA